MLLSKSKTNPAGQVSARTTSGSQRSSVTSSVFQYSSVLVYQILPIRAKRQTAPSVGMRKVLF